MLRAAISKYSTVRLAQELAFGGEPAIPTSAIRLFRLFNSPFGKGKSAAL